MWFSPFYVRPALSQADLDMWGLVRDIRIFFSSALSFPLSYEIVENWLCLHCAVERNSLLFFFPANVVGSADVKWGSPVVIG